MSEGKSNDTLAEEFSSYFLEKIEKTRQQFININPFKPIPTDTPRLWKFAPLTTEVQKEISSMKNKSCELDILQTHLIKDMLPACLDVITTIVNLSLTEGQFCMEWKTAIVKPFLKKAGLELIIKNYRPISNLCFLPKLVERSMLHQLLDHCSENNLLPDFLSVYH